jgi:hypothetical protein
VRLPVVGVPAEQPTGEGGAVAGSTAHVRRRIVVAEDNRGSAEMLATANLMGHANVPGRAGGLDPRSEN